MLIDTQVWTNEWPWKFVDHLFKGLKKETTMPLPWFHQLPHVKWSVRDSLHVQLSAVRPADLQQDTPLGVGGKESCCAREGVDLVALSLVRSSQILFRLGEIWCETILTKNKNRALKVSTNKQTIETHQEVFNNTGRWGRRLCCVRAKKHINTTAFNKAKVNAEFNYVDANTVLFISE